MQASKVASVFQALEDGQIKAARKTFEKDYEKAAKKIAQDPYALMQATLVKAIFASASGHQAEAAGLVEEMCNIIRKLGDNPASIKVGDLTHALNAFKNNELIHLGLQEGYVTVQNNPHFLKFVEAVEYLNSKIKNEEITSFVHNISLMANKHQLFGSMATKMSGAFKKPADYGLNTV